jgi:hypothetical protein
VADAWHERTSGSGSVEGSAQIRDVGVGLEGDVEEVRRCVGDERRHLFEGTLDADLSRDLPTGDITRGLAPDTPRPAA